MSRSVGGQRIRQGLRRMIAPVRPSWKETAWPPATIDRDAEIGTYHEPNLWMVHPELT